MNNFPWAGLILINLPVALAIARWLWLELGETRADRWFALADWAFANGEAAVKRRSVLKARRIFSRQMLRRERDALLEMER